MKLIVLTLGLLGVATCGRLDSKYLPANQGGGTGGYGGAEAPFSGSNAAGSQGGQYSGSNSGQYSGSNSGQYSGSNNGQYSGSQGGQHSGAQILRLENNNNGDGTYNYAYETSDGTSAQEQGTGGVQADGGFSYTSPEGENIQITYVANENGFQPQGAHLPTPPPIPEEILKSIEFNKEEAARGVNQEGAYHEQQYNNNQGGYGGGNGANNANGPEAQYGAPAAQQPFAFGGPAKPFGGPAKPFAPKPQYGAPNQGSSNGGYRY